MRSTDFVLFWTEFFDLWHSLKVPNDVDLLRALHAGMCLLFYLFVWCLTVRCRGAASYCGRDADSKSAVEYEEEGKALGTATETGEDNEHAFEGRDRPFARL